MTQSPEELDAHFGPEGPVAAAKEWLRFVLAEYDLPSAWPLTDPDFRRTMIVAWLDANEGHPAFVGYERQAVLDALAEESPEHPLWPGFAVTQLDEFNTAWANVDLQKWGWASRPRPHGPDTEIVMLVESDGEAFVVEEDSLMIALQLIMRHIPEGGWLVAGVAEPIAPRPS